MASATCRPGRRPRSPPADRAGRPALADDLVVVHDEQPQRSLMAHQTSMACSSLGSRPGNDHDDTGPFAGFALDIQVPPRPAARARMLARPFDRAHRHRRSAPSAVISDSERNAPRRRYPHDGVSSRWRATGQRLAGNRQQIGNNGEGRSPAHRRGPGSRSSCCAAAHRQAH